MKKTSFVSIVTLFFVLLLSASLCSAADKLRLRWGACPTTSGFYAYFVALSKSAMKAYPELDITVVATAGGLDNLKRLREETVDLGGLNTSVSYAMFASIAEYSDKEPFSKLRSLYGGMVLPINIFVRADSDVYKLKDLQGKPFSHIPGSSADRLVLFLLDANGIKPKLLPLGFSSALDAVRTKKAVGSQRIGIGEAAILSLQATTELRFIPISPAEIEKTVQKYPGQVYSVDLPANSFPGQTESVPSLAYSAADFTTSDLPDSAAYKIVRAIHEDRVRLAGLSKSMKKGKFDTAPWSLLYQDVPLHAGAVKYYREIGVKIPKKLIPPEVK